MKFNYLCPLMNAETLPQACEAVDRLLSILHPPSALMDMDAMTNFLAPYVQAVTETQSEDTRQALLFTLYIMLKKADDNSHVQRYFTCSVVLQLLVFHEARRKLSLTAEGVEQGYHAWRSGDRCSMEAQAYVAFLDTIDHLTQQANQLWVMHEANHQRLMRLRASLQVGCRLVKTKLSELAQATSPEQAAEESFLKKILGEEEPSWGIAPEGAEWSLNGFSSRLSRELITVKCLTPSQTNAWFSAFTQGVTNNILKPLEAYENAKSFVAKLKEWMNDALHRVFGARFLSAKSTLHKIITATSGTLTSPAHIGPSPMAKHATDCPQSMKVARP